MRTRNKLTGGIALAMGAATVMLAQPPQIGFRQGAIGGGISANGLAIGGEPVKGAPYSAEAVTETTQIMADGARITRKISVKIYRDSEGRERRDEALNPLTGLSVTPDRPPTISISDPVAGANYMLNVLGHSAIRIPKPSAPPPAFGNSGGGNPAGGVAPAIVFQPTPGPGGARPSPWIIVQGNHQESTGPNPFPAPPPVSPTRIERLEPTMIEGLQAEGTRMIETIPIGRAGNDHPLEMLSETWVSPELHVDLMTRHSDPRTGETVYRLTNLSRAEPDHTLFEVPSDYSISEIPAISGGMITGGVSASPATPRQ
jgi:hypothetical protein